MHAVHAGPGAMRYEDVKRAIDDHLDDAFEGVGEYLRIETRLREARPGVHPHPPYLHMSLSGFVYQPFAPQRLTAVGLAVMSAMSDGAITAALKVSCLVKRGLVPPMTFHSLGSNHNST